MGVALYAFPTESWHSLLALSTQVPGVFTSGVVFLCHVPLQGPGRYTGPGPTLGWFEIAPVSVGVLSQY